MHYVLILQITAILGIIIAALVYLLGPVLLNNLICIPKELSHDAIINITLDIIMVELFNMGAAGVACSTVVAQFISVICSLLYLRERYRDTFDNLIKERWIISFDILIYALYSPVNAFFAGSKRTYIMLICSCVEMSGRILTINLLSKIIGMPSVWLSEPIPWLIVCIGMNVTYFAIIRKNTYPAFDRGKI